MTLQGKSVLVTGNTGLIGSALVAQLAQAGALVTGSHDHREWFLFPKYDYIFHAAGYAAPSRFLEDPLATIRLNTTELMELLGKLNPEGRLLFLSTSEVYSGSTRILHTEDDIGTTSPSHARACYIEAKRCGEAICHAARAAGKAAIIARVSLAYGPGCRKGDKRVMSELIDSALSQGSITLRDGGSDRRTYCYIDDVVEMLLNILLHGRASVYNVGGQSEVSIYLLARKIAEMTKARLNVPRNKLQAMEGAPSHVRLDMSRYTREFGEKQFVPLDEGLKRTVAWHRKLAGVMEAA